MKTTIITLIVSISTLASCRTYKELRGNYGDGQYAEFAFSGNPDKFEYFLRIEMSLLEYSTGNWIRDKNELILYGFTNSNIKTLEIDSSSITKNSVNKDKVIIQYTNNGTYVKADIVVNDNKTLNLHLNRRRFVY